MLLGKIAWKYAFRALPEKLKEKKTIGKWKIKIMQNYVHENAFSDFVFVLFLIWIFDSL